MLTKEDVATSTIVEGWLRDLSLTPTPRADNANTWNLEFTVAGAPTLVMNVVNPKSLPRGVMLVCGLSPMPAHVTAFQGLTAQQRTAFWKDLRSLLSRESVEFQIDGVVAECPKAVRVTALHFDDGLSLDTFARALSSVCKACADLVVLFTERLGDPNVSPGGEFAAQKTATQ
jgi:hypothetical protein